MAFITVEGIDGGGKSSAVDFIQTYFEKKKLPVIKLRQPGGTVVGNTLRKILKYGVEPPESIPTLTEVLLLAASFNQAYEMQIRPALAAGTAVISDRFTDSTLAYQVATGASRAQVKAVFNCLKLPKPDITFLLVGPAEVCLARKNAEAQEKDRFESQGVKLQNMVNLEYLTQASFEPERFKIIDALLAVDERNDIIAARLDDFLTK